MKKIREAIVAAEAKAATDLEVLSTVESEFAEAVKLKYLENLDLHAALAERARLQEQAAQLRKYEEQPPAQGGRHGARTAPRAGGRPYPPERCFSGDSAPRDRDLIRLAFECQVTMSQAKELICVAESPQLPFRRV